ncbi:MAG: hypothetical protein RIM80_06350, partial [Alphaproteobacteria bacterium]
MRLSARIKAAAIVASIAAIAGLLVGAIHYASVVEATHEMSAASLQGQALLIAPKLRRSYDQLR